MQLPHLVYKTANLKNNKYYIGVHSCFCTVPCTYLGSGKALKKAVKKYGVENFKREILASFSTKKAAYAYERTLVKHLDPLSYNLCEGGKGGSKNKIPIVWENTHYPSKAAAARDLKVSASTFNKWYSGKSKPRKLVDEFIFNDVSYNSYAQAARDNKVDPSTIKNWLSKGYTKPPEQFEIELFGKKYRKKLDIAADLGVSPSTVTNLLKNPHKYKGYFMIKGKRYSSQKKASKDLGVWPQTIYKWVNNPNKTDCFKVNL